MSSSTPSISFAKRHIAEVNAPLLHKQGAIDGQDATSILTDIVAELPSVDNAPTYLISSTVTIDKRRFDSTYCRLKATSDLFGSSPAIIIGGTPSNATTMNPPADIDMVVEGNGNYSFPSFSLEPTCDAIKLLSNRAVADRFNLYVSEAKVGVMLEGDNERKAEINVYAVACDTAVKCVDKSGSTDECRINITGGYCRTWLETAQTEENAHYHFNVENNMKDDSQTNPDRWGVILGGGKNLTVSGVIRGHSGNLLKVYRLNPGETTWRDSVHFDNLTVIQCDAGVAFSARRLDRLKGTVNLYDCQNDNGPTAIIDDVYESAGLNVIIDKCFSLYGLVIGEYASMKNSFLNVYVSMGDRYSTKATQLTALKVKSAVNVVFNCEMLRGNVEIEGASGCTFLINKDFIVDGYNLTGGITSIVKLSGNYNSLELGKISWLDEVKSVTIDSFDDTGSPMIYTNGAWQSTVGLSASSTELASKNATINQILKSAGVGVFNTTNSTLYNASGPLSTDAWVPVDGTANIVPTFAAQTTAFVARLPSAMSALEQEVYDRFITLLVSSGVLPKLTHLYAFNSSFEDNAKMNIIANTDTLVSNGDLVFNRLIGFSSPASNGTGYLDGLTSFPLETDMSMGMYVVDPYSSDSERDIENSDSKWNMRAKFSNGGYVEFGGGTTTYSTGGSTQRLIHGTRVGNVQSVFSDGVLQASDTLSSTEPLTNLRLSQSDRNTGMFFMGESIGVLESLKLSEAVNEFESLINELPPPIVTTQHWGGGTINIDNSTNVVANDFSGAASPFVVGKSYRATVNHPANLPSQTFRLRSSNATHFYVGGTADTQTVVEFVADNANIFVQMNGKSATGTATMSIVQLD